MKKILLVLGLVSFTISGAYASIDQNLKYGVKGGEVSELQEFLADKGLLTSNPTGFFGMMTLKAVRAYQVSQNLPSTGFVGPLSRKAINAELDSIVADSRAAEVAETGTSTPVAVDACSNIEGTQTRVPDGMWNNGDGNCFVPSVVANTGSVVPMQNPAIPEVVSKKNVTIVYEIRGNRFAPGSSYGVSVTAQVFDDNGNNTIRYPVYITTPETAHKKLENGVDLSYPAHSKFVYGYTFEVYASGTIPVMIEVPDLNLTKTVEVDVR